MKIPEADGVIESATEPTKNRRKYWLNTTTNQMNVLKNNKYELLNKPINVVSDAEFKTGKLENGKEEWCKRVNTGTLPNTTSKVIDIGFDVKNNPIHKIEGFARNSANGAGRTLPYINSTYTEYSVQVDIWETSKINITTKHDWSSYDTSHIDLYFTKN